MCMHTKSSLLRLSLHRPHPPTKQKQAAGQVPPLAMPVTNPMELIQLQQQQAKQEAEEAGLDFNAMVRVWVGV